MPTTKAKQDKTKTMLAIQEEYRAIRKMVISAAHRADPRAAQEILNSARTALTVNQKNHIEFIRDYNSRLLRRAKGLIDIDDKAYALIEAVIDGLKDLNNVGKLE